MMWGSAYGTTNKLHAEECNHNSSYKVLSAECHQPSYMTASISSGIEVSTEILCQVDYSLLLHLERYEHKILLTTGRISNVNASDNVQ